MQCTYKCNVSKSIDEHEGIPAGSGTHRVTPMEPLQVQKSTMFRTMLLSLNRVGARLGLFASYLHSFLGGVCSGLWGQA